VKSICIVAFAILAVLPCNQIYAIDYAIEFEESDFAFNEENGYTIVRHPDCAYFGDVGAPQLLATSYNFIIPVDKTVLSIDITKTDSERFDGEFDIFPIQEDDYYLTCCSDDTLEWVEPDTKYYESEDPYPEVPVELAYTGLFDGANHIATITVYPIFYVASEKALYYYSLIELTLNIGGTSDEEPIYVSIRMRSDQAVYDKILHDMVEIVKA
jgi:hypothetical protein